MRKIKPEVRATLTTTNGALHRGTFRECLLVWRMLSEREKSSAHIEFPELTRGFYQLEPSEIKKISV